MDKIAGKVQLEPLGWMSQLSQQEMASISVKSKPKKYELFRRCLLAVLSSGAITDDMQALLNAHQAFDVALIRRERGVKIELTHPPQDAFVDGELIRGVHEHVFAVMRDLLFFEQKHNDVMHSAEHSTEIVFDMLRHAQLLERNDAINTVVCWGGHSISDYEYRYTKEVGYQLGLRGFDICTGCGPGAMKGPMKGATIGHAKQRIKQGRYVGFTEPSIIAAEPPNAIVNELLILPDIEKRLEAFIRFGHAIVIFPGGAGTAEELLYILGVLLHDNNHTQHIPIILTGPEKAKGYFEAIDTFIQLTLGNTASDLYQIILGDPVAVSQAITAQKQTIREQRKSIGDSYNFNWKLYITEDFKQPFVPTHANMTALNLSMTQDKAALAANLRRAFSGIVAGNIKAETIESIEQNGLFELNADPVLLQLLDTLLTQFSEQGRMKLPGSDYHPCYRIVETI